MVPLTDCSTLPQPILKSQYYLETLKLVLRRLCRPVHCGSLSLRPPLSSKQMNQGEGDPTTVYILKIEDSLKTLDLEQNCVMMVDDRSRKYARDLTRRHGHLKEEIHLV